MVKVIIVVVLVVVLDRHSSSLLNGKKAIIRAILWMGIRIETAHLDEPPPRQNYKVDEIK